jgi:NADH-quinone oxidoreductase subunit M
VRALFVALALFVFAFAPRTAQAAGTASFVEPGPIALDASGAGKLTLRNTGNEPLHVITLYARSNERDPRIPGTLTASFEGGSTKADLAPGEAKTIALKWDRQGARMVQLFGHVVVESSDVAAPQRAFGVVAQPPASLGFLSHHVGTWLIVLPLLGALALLPLRMTRRIDDRVARLVALAAVGLQAAFAVWALRNFDTLATRADGNDGLQLVERARLFGSVEWYLGFDGLTLPLVLGVIGLGTVGVLARVGRDYEQYFSAYLLSLSALVGALLAVDAMLLLIFLALFAVSIAALIGRSGLRAAIHSLMMHAVAIVVLGIVVFALRRSNDPGFLGDGMRTQSFALPDLARGEWLERMHGGLTLFGKPFVLAAFSAIFVAAAIFLAAAPLHGALGSVLGEAPVGGAILFVTGGSAIGVTILLRFGVSIVPEGVRWGAPLLAALGAGSIVWAALSALGEVDLRRAAGHVGVAHGGVILLGIAAGTPQGVAGAITHAMSRAVVVAMLLLVADALHDRVGVVDRTRFGGLARAMPRFGVLATIAFVASLALPGTMPFVSALLAVGGSLPAHRVATALGALGLALLAVAQLATHRRLLFGELDNKWKNTPELEPFGGKFQDLDRRETGLLIALAVVVIGLGIAPRAFVDLSRGAVADLDARVNPERIAHSSGRTQTFAARQ